MDANATEVQKHGFALKVLDVLERNAVTTKSNQESDENHSSFMTL